MRTAKQLRAKFQEDLEKLQASCKHVKTTWIPYHFAPGHYGGMVLMCERCDKHIQREFKDVTTISWAKDTQV